MPHIRATLVAYAQRDAMIRVTFREKKVGTALATSAALDLARGPFVAFPDHDDELAPSCIEEVVALLRTQRDADLIFTDEDKIDVSCVCSASVRKPGWSTDLFL